MRELDINSWNRKEHFEFFSKFDDPIFGVVMELDCTKAFAFVKQNNYSFFAYYLYHAMVAANKTEEFRYRINKGKVIVYDKVHASSTIGREDGTFAFSFVQFHNEFKIFSECLKTEIEIIQGKSGLNLNENGERPDLIHFSTFPWANFTGLKQARNLSSQDSVPKIVFGKVFERGKQKFMSVSVDMHHGLADGIHIASFMEQFQNGMNTY